MQIYFMVLLRVQGPDLEHTMADLSNTATLIKSYLELKQPTDEHVADIERRLELCCKSTSWEISPYTAWRHQTIHKLYSRLEDLKFKVLETKPLY